MAYGNANITTYGKCENVIEQRIIFYEYLYEYITRNHVYF